MANFRCHRLQAHAVYSLHWEQYSWLGSVPVWEGSNPRLACLSASLLQFWGGKWTLQFHKLCCSGGDVCEFCLKVVTQASALMTIRVVLETWKKPAPIVRSQPFLATLPCSNGLLGVWKPNGLCCGEACAQHSLLFLWFLSLVPVWVEFVCRNCDATQPPIGLRQESRASAVVRVLCRGIRSARSVSLLDCVGGGGGAICLR